VVDEAGAGPALTRAGSRARASTFEEEPAVHPGLSGYPTWCWPPHRQRCTRRAPRWRRSRSRTSGRAEGKTPPTPVNLRPQRA
jgi:hypothetical protein